MNTRFKNSLHHNTKTTSQGREKEKKVEIGGMVEKGKKNRRVCNRERKSALQQDVDKLKKKLRHEENVHRALERAFTRPLGALPRLPPYLPQCTLELLAEVAVLEEEIVRLEQQVVNFRQGLYQEAVYITSSKKPIEIDNIERIRADQQSGKTSTPAARNPENSFLLRQSSTLDSADKNLNSPLSSSSKQKTNKESFVDGKENQSVPNCIKNQQSPLKSGICRTRTSPKPIESPPAQKDRIQLKLEFSPYKNVSGDTARVLHMEEVDASSVPNRISEEILSCLLNVFRRLRSSTSIGSKDEVVVGSTIAVMSEDGEGLSSRDPYGVCSEHGRRRDVGRYKSFREVSSSSIDLSRVVSSQHQPIHRLKELFVKLGSADLRGLTHQQKLAFWINVYNSCMMNAFLEHGIPDSPQTVVGLMRKAVVNVGGHLLNAMTIEHFILRLPYHSKNASCKGVRNDEGTMRSVFGLDWPEPLVTFALTCGSWSSPAVQIYTAKNVEDELEAAKRDYLDAAIGFSKKNDKLIIPKLLDWYLLDFAKDMDALLDWVCLQLPAPTRTEAVKCLEKGRKESPSSRAVQIMPYDFSFRYLLAV